jgi:N-acetylmuramic acid 6-phosphate etherase
VKAKRTARELDRLLTEQSNPGSRDLDKKSALEIARIINREDAKVAGAVKRSLPQIARAIGVIAECLGQGGRLIYVGTGTSGRIAALDAAECPPTFDTDPSVVQFVIAGGERALAAAVEASEDSSESGVRDIAQRNPGPKDVVIGVAASGRTPFTIAAVKYARKAGARTIAVTCNRNSLLGRAAEMEIVTEVGPEVISGSTRMKAGTAQKMVLNMLSAGAMTRLGYVYGNLMVNLHPKNEKLLERATRILQLATGCSRAAAKKYLRLTNGHAPVALLMLKTGVDKSTAEVALLAAHDHVRRAVALAQRSKAKKTPRARQQERD